LDCVAERAPLRLDEQGVDQRDPVRVDHDSCVGAPEPGCLLQPRVHTSIKQLKRHHPILARLLPMPRRMSDRWRVEPGAGVHLDRIDPDSTDGAPGDKKKTSAELTELCERTYDFQERLFAEQKRSLLVVLQ